MLQLSSNNCFNSFLFFFHSQNNTKDTEQMFSERKALCDQISLVEDSAPIWDLLAELFLLKDNNQMFSWDLELDFMLFS